MIVDERTASPIASVSSLGASARSPGPPRAGHHLEHGRPGRAVTDAYDKGAREVDAMDLGTHTQLATNRRYSRNRLAATSRVAVLRFGGKNEPRKKRARNRVRNKVRREGSRDLSKPLKSLWCGRRGSSRTALRPGILSPLRLPVSPRPYEARFFHTLRRK